MSVITMIYVINATLLFLHEMESAYVKEWEILKLPGKNYRFSLITHSGGSGFILGRGGN